MCVYLYVHMSIQLLPNTILILSCSNMAVVANVFIVVLLFLYCCCAVDDIMSSLRMTKYACELVCEKRGEAGRERAVTKYYISKMNERIN